MIAGSTRPGLDRLGMGRAYPGAGGQLGPSFTWGFVAAKQARMSHMESPAPA